MPENATDVMCRLLWIPFQSGSHEQTSNGLFRFEDCPNVLTFPICLNFSAVLVIEGLNSEPRASSLAILLWEYKAQY